MPLWAPPPVATPKFDAEALTKKLQEKQGNMPPPGKDGMDPQVDGTSSYDTDFVNNVTQLGRKVHQITMPTGNPNALPLRQLKFRKQIFEQGEAQKHNHETTKLVVHPQTLSAILNDLADGTTPEKIAEAFNTTPEFLSGLNRFSVAKKMVVIQESAKEGELNHKQTGLGRIEAEDNLGFDKDELKKLKLRISLE